jgi:AraC family transcriptional regulator, melibiose operon regulatory protein
MHILRWELPRPFLLALLSGSMFCDAHSLYTPQFFKQWHQDLAAGRQNLPLMEIKALFFRFAQLAGQQESHLGTQPTADAAHPRANQMALFMSQHFQEPLTTAQIANVVGLHPNYAMHVFKEAFGVSMIDYLTQQRIAYAQQLLITTDASVTEVAMESGFQTLSHFYNVFQRMCGISPGKYKSDLRG